MAQKPPNPPSRPGRAVSVGGNKTNQDRYLLLTALFRQGVLLEQGCPLRARPYGRLFFRGSAPNPVFFLPRSGVFYPGNEKNAQNRTFPLDASRR
jgi:hypothetical protein